MVTGSSDGAFFDLGHMDEIDKLQQANGRLVSGDYKSGEWALWDLATKALIARGKRTQLSGYVSDIQMAGAIFVVQADSGTELRDSGDGHLIKTLPSGKFGVAEDGSYVWVKSSTDLQVWSAAGAHLLTHPGNYANSGIFGAPGELRIGDSTRQNIEYLDIKTGTSTMSPTIAGTFYTWFSDGVRFFTHVGDAYRIYSKDAVQEAFVSSGDPLNGRGGYFWNYHSLYSVAQPSTLLMDLGNTYGNLNTYESGNVIGVMDYGGNGKVKIVRLDPGGISTEDLVLPVDELSEFTADSAGNWSVGTRAGIVYDSANLLAQKGPLSCGGSPWYYYSNTDYINYSSSGSIAVHSLGGGVLNFQAGPTDVTFLGTLPYLGLPYLTTRSSQMSHDGTVFAHLGTMNDGTGEALRVFSLPDRTEIHSWPSPGDVSYENITLSASGTHIGQERLNKTTHKYERIVTDVTGSTTVFQDNPQPSPLYNMSFFPSLFLSPDGALVAVHDNSGLNTQVYKDGKLIDASEGARVLLPATLLLVACGPAPAADAPKPPPAEATAPARSLPSVKSADDERREPDS